MRKNTGNSVHGKRMGTNQSHTRAAGHGGLRASFCPTENEITLSDGGRLLYCQSLTTVFSSKFRGKDDRVKSKAYNERSQAQLRYASGERSYAHKDTKWWRHSLLGTDLGATPPKLVKIIPKLTFDIRRDFAGELTTRSDAKIIGKSTRSAKPSSLSQTFEAPQWSHFSLGDFQSFPTFAVTPDCQERRGFVGHLS
ncbi:hypothetical protein L218DRAFT_947322 [Marasmius fiardii PR-910]|nr:hypothetical protein L218DRAFT_947322 [Marasmius fiardii PR-910]